MDLCLFLNVFRRCSFPQSKTWWLYLARLVQVDGTCCEQGKEWVRPHCEARAVGQTPLRGQAIVIRGHTTKKLSPYCNG